MLCDFWGQDVLKEYSSHLAPCSDSPTLEDEPQSCEEVHTSLIQSDLVEGPG